MSRNLSRHSGVSCDACSKGSFSGKRYKCLVCYDFDLCSDCYEAGETGTGRHTTLHPMQCILTRVDADLFFNGEGHASDQPQCFTCPLCGQLGFSESHLRDHVTKQHADSSSIQEVICPVCAAHPSGDPNHLTDDLPTHLTVEHRALRDMEMDPSVVQSRVRRLIGRRRAGLDRYMGALTREVSQQQQQQQHENSDPITELLSQLSGPNSGSPYASLVAPGSSSSGGGGGGGGGPVPVPRGRIPAEVPSHIQQLIEQQERQAFERGAGLRRPIYRKIVAGQGPPSEGGGVSLGDYVMPGSAYYQLHSRRSQESETVELTRAMLLEGGGREARLMAAAAAAEKASSSGSSAGGGAASKSKFLLANYNVPKLSSDEQDLLERQRADKSLFVQELLLSTLAHDSSSSHSDSSHSDGETAAENT